MSIPILSLAIQQELDVRRARRKAWRMARLLGFDSRQQARIAAAVSETALSALQSAPGGELCFLLDDRIAPRALVVEIRSTSAAGIEARDRELLSTVEELRLRQEELGRVNQELEDTNRGVVALYAELDERADHLRRADEMKSRFLSNMSHEFRTPLNSILALSRLLLDRTDGELTGEQERQVAFIRKSAESLYELVNDLLDLAKVESGKITVRPAEFSVSDVFGALRAMMRPILAATSVELIFEDPAGVPPLHSDEGKISQILRNFISNALKFTEHGEVRVRAELSGNGDTVLFSVSDTGIGIAPEDQESIFQEFTQVEHRLQQKAKGTGLGLPLSRKLAELLGGRVSVSSQPGAGSTFTAELPLTYPAAESDGAAVETARGPATILIIDDEEVSRYVLRQTMAGLPFTIIEAESGEEGLRCAREQQPSRIFLDLMMPGMNGFEVLARLKADEATRRIPVVVTTAKLLTEPEQRYLTETAESVLLKQTLTGSDAAQTVRELISHETTAQAADSQRGR